MKVHKEYICHPECDGYWSFCGIGHGRVSKVWNHVDCRRCLKKRPAPKGVRRPFCAIQRNG